MKYVSSSLFSAQTSPLTMPEDVREDALADLEAYARRRGVHGIRAALAFMSITTEVELGVWWVSHLNEVV